MESLFGFFSATPTTMSNSKKIEHLKVFEKAIAYSILAPIVVDPRWMEVPEDLKTHLKAYRLFEALDCVKNEIATEFEAMVYLLTASLSQPLPETYLRIYLYLFKKYFPSKAKKLNINVAELNDYEKKLLLDLRRWIFKVQMKHINNCLSQTKKRKIVQTTLPTPKPEGRK